MAIGKRAAFRLLVCGIMATCALGCNAFNWGKFQPIVRTASDEKFWLLKNVVLTAGSTAHARTNFDHTMQDVVNVIFVPANEKNNYVTKTVWYDPSGLEYRTIQQTHVLREEQDKAHERPKGGSQRLHSMPLKALYQHKPGLWKVEVYIDNELARRLTFNVD
ncbi:MAG: hypothetical protein LDL33_10090 [Desulfomonile sp.]|nr:hypothetical protein [Desulfomonile sp.]